MAFGSHNVLMNTKPPIPGPSTHSLEVLRESLGNRKSCRYFVDWKIPETFNKVQIHLGMTHYAMI